MLSSYRQHVAERAALGIPPLPLTAQQTADVIELLKNPPAGEEAFLLDLITNRVPAGVDDAAKVKASYLAAIAFGTETNALISRERATQLLGTMLGGYNIHPLVELLDDAQVGTVAADALKHTLLMFDAFHDVQDKALAGNANAKAVIQSWADAEWFTSRPEVPASMTITVFKVTGGARGARRPGPVPASPNSSPSAYRRRATGPARGHRLPPARSVPAGGRTGAGRSAPRCRWGRCRR